MRRAVVWSLLLLTAACAGRADSTAPADADADAGLSALIAGEKQLFVLGAADGLAVEPLVTFDHVCAGIRYVHTLRDSIVLNPDGTARRSFRIDRFADRRMLDSSTLVAVGTWSRLSGSLDRYFASGPSIVLTLSTENSRAPAYTMPLRAHNGRALTNMSAMGGSCPGSANDARNAEFTYTRR